eukprot:c54388_g1_i1.p1 GENE.c54388_g1_i1~~c54388_g1_i1.p1  ORF type:complete len:405 (+),score=61.83 c54388_g1_i1:91-1215(+)
MASTSTPSDAPAAAAPAAPFTPPVLMTRVPGFVKIVEVSPRDGLQNLKTSTEVTVEMKIKLIEMLADAGLKVIEAGAFVSPKWVPKMKGSDQVLREVLSRPEYADISFPALVPNLQGLDKALEAGVKEVAVFTAASESFCQENTNCSIEQSLERCREVVVKCREKDVKVRGYVSCVLGCPYEGEIGPDAVARVTRELLAMGCYEVSLGDTIGVGTPGSTAHMLDAVLAVAPVERLAVHFHDTYGTALANLTVALQYGVSVVDSSVGGLGGCPYASGASGNLATEDAVYLLQGLGVETGIDLTRLCQIGVFISTELNAPYLSRVGQAAGQKQGFRRTRTFYAADGTIRTRYLPPTVPRRRADQPGDKEFLDENLF